MVSPSSPHPPSLLCSVGPAQQEGCLHSRHSSPPSPPSYFISLSAAFTALPVYFWLALFLLPYSFCLSLSPPHPPLSRDPSRSPTCWTAGTVSSAPRSQRVHVSSLVTPCLPLLALAISFYRFPDISICSLCLRLTPEYHRPPQTHTFCLSLKFHEKRLK